MFLSCVLNQIGKKVLWYNKILLYFPQFTFVFPFLQTSLSLEKQIIVLVRLESNQLVDISQPCMKRLFMTQTRNNRLSQNCYRFDWAEQAQQLILKQTVPSIAYSHMDIQLQDLAGKKEHSHKIKFISADDNEYISPEDQPVQVL